ncbi:ComF family protein [Gemella taiwanensis]|jgi:putative comf operon protein 3
MNCSFCGSEIRSKLGFDTIFKTREKFQLCAECKVHLDINVLEVGEYTLYYFSDYEFVKDDIYSIKYFGDVACALKFKNLFKQFLSLNKFDLITIVPANEIREIIRGFDHIEQLCKMCDINFEKILGCEYREKQAKLHKERGENKYYILPNGQNLGTVRSMLIIDDIFTSGNTLLGCAKTIRELYPKINISFLTLSKVI